jgi:type VI secretion system protein VasD
VSPRRAFLAAAAATALAGCGGAPAPAVVDLTLTAGRDLNQDTAGTPRSVAVRLYGLTSRARFSSADAYALMDRDKTVLGDEGSVIEQIVIKPGETRKLTLLPKPGVRYIGAAVLFQDIDRARWRAVAQIAPEGVTRLALVLGSKSAQLEGA